MTTIALVVVSTAPPYNTLKYTPIEAERLWIVDEIGSIQLFYSK